MHYLMEIFNYLIHPYFYLKKYTRKLVVIVVFSITINLEDNKRLFNTTFFRVCLYLLQLEGIINGGFRIDRYVHVGVEIFVRHIRLELDRR